MSPCSLHSLSVPHPCSGRPDFSALLLRAFVLMPHPCLKSCSEVTSSVGPSLIPLFNIAHTPVSPLQDSLSPLLALFFFIAFNYLGIYYIIFIGWSVSPTEL